MVALPPEFGKQTREVMKFGFGADEIARAQERQGGLSRVRTGNHPTARDHAVDELGKNIWRRKRPAKWPMTTIMALLDTSDCKTCPS
ncbi:hypothetical protein ABIA06_002589 [Bradyrhizobium yuanmingense]